MTDLEAMDRTGVEDYARYAGEHLESGSGVSLRMSPAAGQEEA